ncbi:MAG: glycosyl hydrolase 53 family protein [Myxococcota bacterium]
MHPTFPVRSRVAPLARLACIWLLAAAVPALGCSSDAPSQAGKGGSSSAGSSGSNSGGSSSGGTSNSNGGTSSNSGGQLNGGSQGFGGASGGSSGGAQNNGGTTSAGANNNGGNTSASGGKASSGGSSAGGSAQGGTGSGGKGGTSAGGAGGSASGGKAGASSGGAASGGSSSGGASSVNPVFILGADISGTQESNTTYRDTDGQTKSLLQLLKRHGFNYIRLKTFVDPKAPYGYASNANSCAGLPEAFGDRDHVVAFGKQIKAAGMGFLLDFHYSDTWADPGNQIIPQKWRNAASIDELASLLNAYTKDVITTAISAGARPDMVQVGNEITPGMLMHVPGPNTDCWGNNPQSASISGSISNWNNLAKLLIAGIQGVREVDADIKIMLHVENTRDLAGIKRFVDNAQARNVSFDILGLSCYVAFQGQPSVWENTFTQLASSYPNLKFAIAEYNPERTRANQIIKALPGGRGVGTFFWEPTRSGEWGNSMFSFQGGTAVANTQDFAEFDAMLPQLGL